jgi:hypothetical protein
MKWRLQMADSKVFVITHKECEIPKIEGQYILLVGAENKSGEIKYDFRDNTGENISYKNKNYCELTGVYWIWKNVDADIVGLCHYRRFFTNARWSKNPKYYLNNHDINVLFEKYDVIMPERLYYLANIKDIVKHAPNLADLEEIRRAICALYSGYLEDYEKFLSQRSAFLFNMCIMRKEIFDRYCQWIFDILFFIEEHHDMSREDSYRQRLFGFLSERLIYVWVYHNIPADKIKEMPVVRTDISSHEIVSKDIKNKIKKNLTFSILGKDIC